MLYAPFVSIEIIPPARPRNLNRRRIARRKFDLFGPVYTTLSRYSSEPRLVKSFHRITTSNYSVRSSGMSALLSFPCCLGIATNRLIVSARRVFIKGFRAEITFIVATFGEKLGKIIQLKVGASHKRQRECVARLWKIPWCLVLRL